MKVLKFWWTSMWSSLRILKVAQIVIDSHKKENCLVVVSAMSWITDKLLELAKYAWKWKYPKVKKILDSIERHHKTTLLEIVWIENYQNIWDKNFKKKFEELELISKWTSLLWDVSEKYQASIWYFWEILSSLLLVEAIKEKWLGSIWLMSRDLIRTDKNYLDAKVDFKKTKSLVSKKLSKINYKKTIPVVTWFAGWDLDWNTTLLARWGSDYVATILWEATKSDSVEIWTDVAWIFSWDPRIIKNPVCFEKLDYRVCAELALAGAKVLHPKTISPMVRSNIPVYVKSTLEPEKNWTKICKHKEKWVKWLNLNNNNVLFHFTDNTMFWSVWYINEITCIFRKNNIPIDSITTSEVSFTCSIKKSDLSKKVLKELKKTWDVEIIENLSKISVVWEYIWYNCKVMQNIFNTLEGHKIYLVSKWASFNNITLFVDNNKSKEILELLHNKLF